MLGNRVGSSPFRGKVLRKSGESVEMKERFFTKYADRIEAMSRKMAERLAEGKKLLTIAWLGKDGGRIGEMADHAFVVPSFSIH